MIAYHILFKGLIAHDLALLFHKVVCHDLVDLDLLVDSSGHDLFVDGLICPADKIALEIHILIVHVADIRQRLKDINIVHIKRMLRKL